MRYFLLILILVTTDSFCQENTEKYSFVNPKETIPRFLEDKNLTEKENQVSFKTKIKEHFIKHIELSQALDSIKNKIYVSFKIDSLGFSKFYGIKPTNYDTKYLRNEFSNIVNSLPTFIPATQRNRKINIIYSIPVFRNK